MNLTRQLTCIELLEKIFSDKFISDYFLNADPAVLRDLVRNDLLSSLLAAKPKPLQQQMIAKYLKSNIIKTILGGLYRELLEHKREAFPPGLFVGFQGKLNCQILFKHVFIDILHWPITKIVQELDKNILTQHKLRSMLLCYPVFTSLVIESFPGHHIKHFYFPKVKHIWKDKNRQHNEPLIKEAIQELIAILTDKRGEFKYSEKQIPQWIRYEHFQKKILPFKTNLSYMLESCFKNSPAQAIIFAYPELKLKPHYFRHISKGYWQSPEKVKEVVEELLERLTDPKGKYQFTQTELETFLTSEFYAKPLLPYRKTVTGLLKLGLKNNVKGLLQQQK